MECSVSAPRPTFAPVAWRLNQAGFRCRKCTRCSVDTLSLCWTDDHKHYRSHISPLKGCGSLASLSKWYRNLPEVVKDVMHEVGFEHFMKILPSFWANMSILYACAERWWDTTNTFQFRFGVMTMKPKKNGALLGLAIMSSHKGDSNIRCTTLRQAYEDNQDWSDENIAFCTRAFLLCLVGSLIFSNSAQNVSTGLLETFAELNEVGNFD
ncbi:hypothetical protein Vadar_020284 [Vaccinium darrowii]|uniref:Uncharacterized protein n=1 Tax=Vaccinium darrowii TaxID=229202 RepID=A0ACB7YFT8_9ERIC|nr:hypothetical protein Vadar_020284 [Vaccinium darrowii]